MVMKNEMLEIIANRYTCRAFTDQAVEKEKLEAIALAGVQAPSSNNLQGWHIIVVSDKEYVDKLDELTIKGIKKTNTQLYERIMSRTGKALYNAPALCIIATPQAAQYPVEMDSGIVCENIVLAATALGLGTCINRVVSAAILGSEKKAIYEALGIPEGYEFSIGVLLGYSEYQGAPHDIDEGKITYIEQVVSHKK